jgi:MFS family permease
VAVLAADVTSLKNRGIGFAFTSSPYMITAFAGSKAAEAFLLRVNWRWAFGAFAIIVPCVTMPLFALLKHEQHKAEKHGIIDLETSTGPLRQQICEGIVGFDRE